MKSSLTLPQALMLLALRDDKGSLYSGYFPQALAGAALTELLLAESLVSQQQAKPKYVCAENVKLDSKFLNEILDYIREDGKPRSLKNLAERISQKSQFIKTLGSELCDLGAVAEEKSKILGIFPSTKWPTVNGRIEAGLIEEIRKALNPTLPIEDMDDKIGLLIVLAEAGGFLKYNLDKDFYKISKSRLKNMKNAEFINSKEFVKVIKDTEAAMMSIIIAAAVIPAVSAG